MSSEYIYFINDKRGQNLKIMVLLSILIITSSLIMGGCVKRTVTKQAAEESTEPQTTTNKYEMHFGVGGGLYPDIKQGEEKIKEKTRELDELGIVWLRQPGKGISWYEVQPTKDSWDFRKLDAVIDGNKHPLIIPIYGMVGNVYPFGGFSREHLLSLNNREEVIDYIIAHSVDMDDPRQRADAEVYVKKLIDRYKGKIKYWEIGGNEGIGSQGRLDIVTNTYTWVKEEDPDAIVLVTAVGGDDDKQFYSGLTAFDDLLARGMGGYFDVAHFHYYGILGGDFEKRLEQ